MIINVKKLSV